MRDRYWLRLNCNHQVGDFMRYLLGGGFEEWVKHSGVSEKSFLCECDFEPIAAYVLLMKGS